MNISDAQEWWNRKRLDLADDEVIEFLFAEIRAQKKTLADCESLARGIIKRRQSGYIGDHNDVLTIVKITADALAESV